MLLLIFLKNWKRKKKKRSWKLFFGYLRCKQNLGAERGGNRIRVQDHPKLNLPAQTNQCFMKKKKGRENKRPGNFKIRSDLHHYWYSNLPLCRPAQSTETSVLPVAIWRKMGIKIDWTYCWYVIWADRPNTMRPESLFIRKVKGNTCSEVYIFHYYLIWLFRYSDLSNAYNDGLIA